MRATAEPAPPPLALDTPAPAASADSAFSSRRALIKASLLLAICVAAMLVVYLTPLRQYIRDLSAQHVDRLGHYSYPAFMALCAGMVAIGAPRLLFATLGGVGFGFVVGALLAQLGTVIGCYITYLYGRYLGREYVERSLQGRFKRLDWLLARLEEHGIAGNLLIRTMPVGNNFLTNLFFSVSPIRSTPYLIGTTLGTLPGTLIYALLGSSAQTHSGLRMALSIGLFIAWCVFYGVWLRRVLRSRVGDTAT